MSIGPFARSALLAPRPSDGPAGAADELSALFVFGDSLSDNGSVFLLSGGTAPAPSLNGALPDGTPVDLAAQGIFYDGVFTNGQVYSDIAADLLGLPGNTGSFLTGGTNFALGGGTALGNNPLSGQVDAFESAIAALPVGQGAALLANAGASVFIGLNDLLAIGQAAITPAGVDFAAVAAGIEAATDEIAVQTQRLADLGVGTIVINTLPPASLFPASDPLVAPVGGTEPLDGFSDAFNDRLLADAATLAATGVEVRIVDFASLGQEVLDDAATFGLLSLDAALSGAGTSPDVTLLTPDVPIDQLGFIDQVHFTASLHGVFGVFQATTLDDALVDGTDGADLLRTGRGEQTIFADDGADLVFAGTGDDLVFGGRGADAVFGGRGHDILFGGTGNDAVTGGGGRDIASGGSGNDVVSGGGGGDIVAGDAGDDLLFGGRGGDLLIDGLGSDVAHGGRGADLFLYRDAALLGGAGGDSDTFFGGSGFDTLLVVTGEAVDDQAAYLDANDIATYGVERTAFLTADDLAAFDFGDLAEQVAFADLFGLV